MVHRKEIFYPEAEIRIQSDVQWEKIFLHYDGIFTTFSSNRSPAEKNQLESHILICLSASQACLELTA